MSLRFNPLIFSGLDFTGSGGGSSYWADAVANAAALPASGSVDGETRVTQDTSKVYVWSLTDGKWIDTGITVVGFGSSPNVNGLTLTKLTVGNTEQRTLNLEPADATHPGGISTSSQTFAGNKTFTGNVIAQSSVVTNSIDTPGATTLSIGAVNASIINLGNSSSTINFAGTVNNNNVTNLVVADQLITINHGGGVGSASGAGFEIEENALITGYFKTSGDRNSYILKAPNTAGIATITPGASGITLNQSSHDPVTFAAVGSSPNANGASLSTQQITLQPADGTNPGLLSATAQTIGGNKTFNGSTNLSGGATIAALSGPLRGTAGVVSTGATSLTSEVSGILPQANGGFGTNTSAFTGVVKASAGTFSASALTDSDIASGAAIARSKIATSTINAVVIDDGSGNLSTTTLSAGQILQGNGSAVPTPTTVAGDVLISSSGVTALQANTVSNVNITAAAAIARSKIASGSANQVVINDGSGNLSSEAALASSRGGLGINASAFTGVVKASSGSFSASTIVNADIDPAAAIVDTKLATISTAGKVSNSATTATSSNTPSTIVLRDASGNFSAGTITATLSGSSSGNLAKAAGDIDETSFSITNNQSAAANVTGFAFANGTVRSFKAVVSIFINATTPLYESFDLQGIQKAASWNISAVNVGDASGIVFTITSAGQIQYTSSNYTGFVAGTMKFRALTTSV